MKRHKAFKFELNSTKSQRDLLNQTFGVNRQFWNHLVTIVIFNFLITISGTYKNFDKDED